MFKFNRYIAALMTAFALIVAMATSASAATTAEFSASWSQNAEANAEAMGVAISGADATGKLLLEEERTRSPHAVLRSLTPPTEAQVAKYATSVSSMSQAQATLNAEVVIYDKQITVAKKKVAKLKLRIKHADSSADKEVLKKKLKKAKKMLRRITTSWEFKPLLKFERGMCYRNTGRDDNLNLRSFVDCVDGDKAYVVVGWVPELRDTVIVAVKKTNGEYLAGCNNFVYFNIPLGTPDRSMVIIVRALAEVELTVSVGVRVVGDLTVTGVMKQDGVVCDQDSKTQHVNELKQLAPITVKATDTDKALAFGQERVQANAEARAEVKQSIAATLMQSISLNIQLSCETPPEVNQPPRGEIVQWPAHQDQNEYYRIKYVGSSVEHGGNVVNECTVSGGASRVYNDPNHPTIEDVEGNQKVTTFWIKSHGSADVQVELACQTTDPETLKSVIYTKTWMVVAMPV